MSSISSLYRQVLFTLNRPLAVFDNNTRNKACDFVLQGGLAESDIEALACLTQSTDWIEDQSFSGIHKIVCGLSMKSLEEAIISQPEALDSRDALGRTPLIWAAARGNAANVAILLSHGANFDVLDHQLTSAVSYAGDRNHAVCVRLLLEAGAETDPKMPHGIVVGSALNCAARNASDPLIIKTILDFGADIEAAGHDGRTSLLHVARTDNSSFAMILLEHGANLNATSAADQTPLTTAIINNSHNVLRSLLDRWSEYSECPRLKGPHLLQIAAMYGDIETLQILAKSDHVRMKYDREYSLGNFVGRLQNRYDFSEKLVLAFEDLLAVINTVPQNGLYEEDLMEKGFISWHSSAGSHCGSEFSSSLPNHKVAEEADSSDSGHCTFEDALEYLDSGDQSIESEPTSV